MSSRASQNLSGFVVHRRPHGSSSSSSRLPLSTGSTCSAMPAQGIRRHCSQHRSCPTSSTHSKARRHRRSMASSSSNNSSAQTAPRLLQRPAAAAHSGGRHCQMATCCRRQSHRERLSCICSRSGASLVGAPMPFHRMRLCTQLTVMAHIPVRHRHRSDTAPSRGDTGGAARITGSSGSRPIRPLSFSGSLSAPARVGFHIQQHCKGPA